ncbi:response regulator [Marispirochaeta sp.]|uniref:sensor histidine kinase n=1 Tax=Marispirochaeta sp. TaxID=2038653 RepID=UPI0029C8034A|nr:response regulator [Marispirochaeta sp.]
MNMEEVATVFITDDNPENLSVLSSILEAAGYRTRAALSGTEMLDSIQKQIPDLIILDIHMPKLDGYEVCEQLKQSAKFRDIPVIFCSALGESYNIIKAFDLGGVDYITKPFRGKEVIARVRTHLTLRQKQHELEQAMARLHATQEQLIQTEKMYSMGLMVAGIAHQINNPVNYIINSLNGFRVDLRDLMKLMDQYAKSDPHLPPPMAERVSHIKQEIEYPALIQEMYDLLDGIYQGSMKVHGIVKSLQNFSSSGNRDREPVDIATEIDHAVLMIENQLDDSLKIIHERHEVPPVFTCPGKISQVILQLLQNAVDAVERKKSGENVITIYTFSFEKENRKNCCIQITDTGIGMNSDEVSHALDPFFTTNDSGSRIGLGLTSSYRIVQDMGGTLHIESSEANGTTVSVELPAAID